MKSDIYNTEHGYTLFETMLMVCVSALTNGFMIINITYAFKRGTQHMQFLTVLIVLTSFMYHLCDSVDSQIFLSELDWHKLDNIGSICGFVFYTQFQIELFIYLMQLPAERRLALSWISFIFVIIIQEDHPWELWATVVPILIVAIIYALTKVKKTPNGYLRKGVILMSIALVAFYMGLDEYADYLRCWHGIWHVMVSLALYHLFQAYEPEPITIRELWKSNISYIKI